MERPTAAALVAHHLDGAPPRVPATTENDADANQRIPPEAKDSIRQVGAAAGQGLFGALVFAVIFTITAGLGFLVHQGAIDSGPFLLAVGILLGFFLGHVNAVS